MAVEHFDVLVVGAGISGIGAGYHLQKHCPGKHYAILEGRDAMGGTWDLFRYPGIRSDSDMYTLGYAFKPWTNAKAIADGPSILDYLHETAREHGVDGKIRYGHKVRRASWSSEDARWTVEAEHAGETRRFTCGFLFMCSGYYDYDAGYTPEFKSIEQFAGQIVHPQKWTGDVDYKGKRVVVIGSGATAVTLVPEMAKDAAHVTMLQRSPTYIVSRPSEDRLANRLRSVLPAKLAYGITRWKNVLLGMFFFNLARKRPERVKGKILEAVTAELGPDYDVETHFSPRYNPWDQRLCLVPDGDLFESLREGSASIVTDTIDSFTPRGIRLSSGTELNADLIVTATGLNIKLLGGLEVVVDGVPVNPARSLAYKGMMYSGIPNMASSFGYTNASWTLKADLTCGYVCRLLEHMDKIGMRQCTPIAADDQVPEEPFLDFTSGYVQRAVDKMPKQGAHRPWRVHQNYALDLLAFRFGKLEDDAMVFSNPRRASERIKATTAREAPAPVVAP
ncbi:flavin-containing monooxygenase [Sphingomonas cavernae]|uniref:NAD(P)/FAD-dependent oxidoreductase n=1 Tax=Sphingomonas cavernae TaxID=2320861 RepID=A0A418WLR7_9SPHN|nr:NAD(P)/FAD-dependent oxidoreductase [Sphingomonas cavernae]RJF90955.1 NAD(P)/FAD-dependent oxidoreductase [Sphingomonas cavernae]